jgi:hypothetical protein
VEKSEFHLQVWLLLEEVFKKGELSCMVPQAPGFRAIPDNLNGPSIVRDKRWFYFLCSFPEVEIVTRFDETGARWSGEADNKPRRELLLVGIGPIEAGAFIPERELIRIPESERFPFKVFKHELAGGSADFRKWKVVVVVAFLRVDDFAVG